MNSRMVLWLLAAALFLSAAPALVHEDNPVEDPFASMTNAQLVEIMKTSPKSTLEYEKFNSASKEICLRGPNPEIISLLMGVVNEFPENVSRETVILLVAFRAREVTPTLVSWLGDYRETWKIHFAIAQLDKMLDPASKPALIEFFRSSHLDQSRGKVMVILAELGSKELIPEFKPLLTDRLSYLQVYSAQALGILGDKSGRKTVQEILKGRYLNKQAVEALAAIGDWGDLGFLNELEKKFSDEPNIAALFEAARCRIEMAGLSEDLKIKKISKIMAEPMEMKRMELGLWLLDQLERSNDPRALEILKQVALGNTAYLFREEAFRGLAVKGILLAHQKLEKHQYHFSLPSAPAPGNGAGQGAK